MVKKRERSEKRQREGPDRMSDTVAGNAPICCLPLKIDEEIGASADFTGG